MKIYSKPIGPVKKFKAILKSYIEEIKKNMSNGTVILASIFHFCRCKKPGKEENNSQSTSIHETHQFRNLNLRSILNVF